MEEITCERKIESVIRVIDNPIRKGLIGRFIFWEPKKIYVREYKEIQRGTKMKLINIYKADISNRIKKKCEELYQKISDENVEFENNYIQLNIEYFEKYSEMMNKTNYDMPFYIESWSGLRALLGLVYKCYFDDTLKKINDDTSKIFRNLNENCKDTINLDEYIRSDIFRETMHNHVDVFALSGLISEYIMVEKTFLDIEKLKELYGVQLTENDPLVIAYMIENQYPIYYCSKKQAKAVELLLGQQSVFDKLLRTSKG